MNTETGHFVAFDVAVNESTPRMTRIEVDEVVKVKGERFRVVNIGERLLTLELMSAKDIELDKQAKRRAGHLSDSPRNRAERRREAALRKREKRREAKS